MQALTSDTLQQLNVSTFDDYIKELPNVTTASNGPGQNEVFMRGLSAGSQASQGSGSTGLNPNVAIYLDNQSGQLPNRNLDIYAADLNRIEVLEGPQGTLFGAGAEAGVIRYITNEPKLDVTEGNVKAGYGYTGGGDPNVDVTAVLNLPLIADTLAVRAVVYDDRRGGYINNVPATFTRHDTDIGIHYAGYPAVDGACPDGGVNNGYCAPPGSPSINNAAVVGNAINPVTYPGLRFEALYKFNDNWDALITQSYQSMEADRRVLSAAQCLQWRAVAAAAGHAVQSGVRQGQLREHGMDRQWQDRGLEGRLYGRLPGAQRRSGGRLHQLRTRRIRRLLSVRRPGCRRCCSTCYSPSSTWRSTERNTHQQHEFRLSTPDDWRLRAIGGAFWENNTVYDQTAWMYKTVPPCTSNGAAGTPGNAGCLSNVGTFPGATVSKPGCAEQQHLLLSGPIRGRPSSWRSSPRWTST